jgi:hypothetical protein
MEMRKLKTKDLFKFTRILRKLGIKDSLKQATENYNAEGKKKGEILEDLGTDMVFIILERLDLAENEIAEFMGDLLGIKPKEFLDMEIEETINAFKKLFGQEGFMSFFKQAAK